MTQWQSDDLMTDDDVVIRREQVATALAAVRNRIEAAREAVGRTDEVALVVVTKTFPAADIDLLLSLGVRDVAENRDQEARAKRDVVGGPDAGRVRWHMIGQLQRNKATSVARWADVVETVDRIELAAPLARAADTAGRRLEVFIQVSLDPDARPERGGVEPARAVDLAAAVAAEQTLDLVGVMGVAPFPGDPQEAFGRLAEVSLQVRARWPEAFGISAGMSADLEQAVANGATQVRVGGAILGPRSSVQ
jgi:pyridoxal phosphate enzyme (YggS family)